MTVLLIFFALPIATIIISIALQKIFKCPFLVAAIIFAIFLVVTFILGNLLFLVAAIAYAIIAFITAFLTKWFCRFIDEFNRRNCDRDRDRDRDRERDRDRDRCRCRDRDRDDDNDCRCRMFKK